MKKWSVYFLLSLVLLIALAVIPRESMGLWGVVNLYSLIRIFLLLLVLQMVSLFVTERFNGQQGGLLLGFFAGLISGTAITASISRQSYECNENQIRLLSLVYLSALLGTLSEAVVLVLVGMEQFHVRLLLVFVGPVIAIAVLLQGRLQTIRKIDFGRQAIPPVGLKSLLALGIIIAVFITLSKILQGALGEAGQYVLTFLVCFFELHGSIIGNTQLFNDAVITEAQLGDLIFIGILASCLAKAVLVSTLATEPLRRRILKYTAWLVASTVLSWVTFRIVGV